MAAPRTAPSAVLIGASPLSAWVLVVVGLLVMATTVPLAVSAAADAPLFLGVLSLAVFGFGGWLTLHGLRLLRLRDAALVLDAEGFQDRRIRTGRIAWADVREVKKERQDVDNTMQVVLCIRFEDPAALTPRFGLGTRLRARFSNADLVVQLGGLRADPDEVAEMAIGFWKLRGD